MGKINLSYNIINLSGGAPEGIYPEAFEFYMTNYLNELK